MWRGTAFIADSTTSSAMPCVAQPLDHARARARRRHADAVALRRRASPSPLPQCALSAIAMRPRHQLAMREVDLQRRDRHVVGADRVEIGALARVGRLARRADPVHRLAARILRADHVLGLVPSPEARHLHALQRAQRYVRHVDVEQPRAGRRARMPLAPARPLPAPPSRNARPSSTRARWRSKECRAGSPRSRPPRCPSRSCRRPCWRRD